MDSDSRSLTNHNRTFLVHGYIFTADETRNSYSVGPYPKAVANDSVLVSSERALMNAQVLFHSNTLSLTQPLKRLMKNLSLSLLFKERR